MKDAFMQKVKPVSTYPADSSEASAKLLTREQPLTLSNEGQRRVRHSAAMLGLALSMGATGILLHSHEDQAVAADSVTLESRLVGIPNQDEATDSASTARVSVEPAPATDAPESRFTSSTKSVASAKAEVEPAPPLIKHKVKEGETLWELSSSYAVEPEAIAASNQIQPQATLTVGQTLNIPPVNGIVHQTKEEETVAQVSQSYRIQPEQINLQSSVSDKLSVGESITVPGKVDQLLQNRQETALNHLKQEKERLETSLGMFRSEETTVPNLAALPESQNAKEVKREAIAETEVEGAMAIPVLSPEKPVTQPSQLIELEKQIAERARVTSNTLPQPPELRNLNSTEDQATVKQPVIIPLSPSLSPASVNSNGVGTNEKLTNQPISIPVAVPENSTQQEQARTIIPKLEVAQTELAKPVVVAASSQPTYRVQRGDTLDSIARRHGISRSELARANGIMNPNLIKVNQQLTIPNNQRVDTHQPLTLIPQTVLSEPNLTALQPQLSTNPPTTNRWHNRLNQSPDQVNTQNNPYVDKLRSDLARMRQEHQNQQPTVTTNAPSNSNVNNGASVALNPEWQQDNSRLQFSTGLNQLQQTKPVLEVTVEDQRQPQINATRRAINAAAPDVVAVAPVEVENYNRSIQIPVGEPVSPELAPPDQYLPDNPSTFNGYIWPTKGVLTSGYGRRWGRMHKGIDIAAPIGTPIFAAAAGEVVSAGWNSGGYGNLVKIQHSDGSVTLYAHNNRILVRRGQFVEQGQQISEMGSTGYSTGPHLHFEVHPSGKGAVNPIAFLPKR